MTDEKRLSADWKISIHALLAESDARAVFIASGIASFLSTLSLRRATQTKALKVAAHSISIHALLAESDNVIDHSTHPHKSFLSTLSLRRATLGAGKSCDVRGNFYPRSPCGERLDLTFH